MARAQQLGVHAVEPDAPQVRHGREAQLVPERRVQRADAHAADPRQLAGRQRLVGVGLHVGQHGLQPRRAAARHVALERVAVGVGHGQQHLRHHERLQLLAGQRALRDAARPVQLARQELDGREQAAAASRRRAEAEPEVDGLVDGAADEVGEVRLEPGARDLEDELLGVVGLAHGVELVG
jgi:hypothetical protein